MYGNGYGSLFLQVLLEGTFEDNIAAVVPLNIGKYYTKLGEQAMVNLTLANLGTSPITSIDYQIGNANSEELSEQQHMDLETPIPFVSSELISLPVDPQPEIGSKQMTLHVTKVNGEENKLVRYGLRLVPARTHRYGQAAQDFRRPFHWYRPASV